MRKTERTMKYRKASSLLGAHFSIAKGLHHALFEAETYGCTALQIFTKNNSAWKERTLTHEEIDRFDRAREQTDITSIASHTSYLNIVVFFILNTIYGFFYLLDIPCP